MKKLLLIFNLLLISKLTSAQFGNALEFNGTGDFVLTPNQAPYKIGSGSFSIACWAKLASAASQFGVDRILMPTTNKGPGIFIENNKLVISKVGVSEASSNGTINDTLWHHLAVTYNGTKVKFYIDGVFDSEANYSPGFADTNSYYSIGSTGASEYFKGKLDQVQVYASQLTASEISFIMCDENATNMSPIRHYKFNESSGTSASDASAANATGTLVGNPKWVTSGVVCGVGINDNKQFSNFIISPNPATSVLNISFNDQVKNAFLSVTNILGEVVLTQSLQVAKINISVNSFSKGVYFLTIVNDGKQHTTKFVIE